MDLVQTIFSVLSPRILQFAEPLIYIRGSAEYSIVFEPFDSPILLCITIIKLLGKTW